MIVIFFLDRNYRVLPHSIHGYLPSHHTGTAITDITLKKCSSLNVFSSCKLDTTVWHRIDKDLYLQHSMFSSAYLYIQRKREEELTPEDKVVIDVSVGRLDPRARGGAEGAGVPGQQPRDVDGDEVQRIPGIGELEPFAREVLAHLGGGGLVRAAGAGVAVIHTGPR